MHADAGGSVELTGTATSLLRLGEICELVLPFGLRRGGAWNPKLPGFEFCDGKSEGSVLLRDVDEWWPASVKF